MHFHRVLSFLQKKSKDYDWVTRSQMMKVLLHPISESLWFFDLAPYFFGNDAASGNIAMTTKIFSSTMHDDVLLPNQTVGKKMGSPRYYHIVIIF